MQLYDVPAEAPAPASAAGLASAAAAPAPVAQAAALGRLYTQSPYQDDSRKFHMDMKIPPRDVYTGVSAWEGRVVVIPRFKAFQFDILAKFW